MTEYSNTLCLSARTYVQRPAGQTGVGTDISSSQSNASADSLVLLKEPQPSEILPPQLDSDMHPADNRKQRLARNRATAALSRERKKAHTDVLAQKVSLLEKSNRSLIQQLAAKSEEVTFLKSQLKGELTDASSQQPGSDGAPEISQATQTHIVMPATSALPRIFCNVANPPSSSYPHQPNATSASFESQPATNATPAGMHQPHSQQSQCKLEHSMSSDMTYQPITIKPELEDSRRSERIRHAVITSGHAPSFGGEHSGMCQTQHAGTDHFRVPQSQPTLCATRDQQSGHVPPPLGSSQHFDWSACLPYQQPQQQAAGSHVSWQHYAPADALNNYPYQRAFSQPFDAASGLSAPHDQLLMSPKMFSEQELIAWRLLPQQLPHLEELSDFQPNGSMHLLACQPQPDCQDIAEGLSQECMHDTSGSLSGSPEAA